MAYTSVSVSGYNSNPPLDDGSTGPNNSAKWATIKTKLFDPVKTALETIDDNIKTAITTADSSLTTLQADVSTASSNVSALSSSLTAASGTVMLFQQTTAPTGWAKGASFDDYALRLVTGTASSGGSTAFTTVFKARTIATANLPSHTHSFSDTSRTIDFSGTTTAKVYSVSANQDDAGGGSVREVLSDVSESNSTLTATYTMACTSNSSGSGGTWGFAVQYVDMIYATKS